MGCASLLRERPIRPICEHPGPRVTRTLLAANAPTRKSLPPEFIANHGGSADPGRVDGGEHSQVFDDNKNDQTAGNSRRKRSMRQGIREDHAVASNERDGRYSEYPRVPGQVTAPSYRFMELAHRVTLPGVRGSQEQTADCGIPAGRLQRSLVLPPPGSR